MPIGMRMVELSKKLLFNIYRRKEKNTSLARIQRINSLQKVKKRQGLVDLKKPIVKPQTLKGIIKQYLNLKVQWNNYKFKVLIDSKVIKNYILLAIAERLKILCRLKESLYLLVIILGDPIFYKNGVIRIKTKPLKLKIKG